MAQGNWEADKMLDIYIYDYLIKRNLQATAKAFMAEGKVVVSPVAIDAPGGFLFEWWSIFWDVFMSRKNIKHSDDAAAYIESQQMKVKELQFQQYQQLPLEAQMHRDASPLAGHLRNMNSMDSEALLKSATIFPGQLLQGNVPLSPQIQGQNPQTTDIRTGSGFSQRSSLGGPSSLNGQGLVQGKAGFGCSGLNQGVGDSTLLNGLPVKDGQQVQPSFMPASNHYQILSVPPQQHLPQAHAPHFGEMDPRRLRDLSKGDSNRKNGQPMWNDGLVDSPMQPSSLIRQDHAAYTIKHRTGQMQLSPAEQSQGQMQQQHQLEQIRTGQMQLSPAQQSQGHMQQQHQLEQNNRKRKPTSFGAANSTGAGNTAGPSNSLPLSPTSTAGDGVAKAGNIPQASGIPKSSIKYGMDGVAGFTTSLNQLDDLERVGDVGSLDDPVESFLAIDEGDGRDIFAPVKSGSVEHNLETLNDRPFSEIASQTSNNKVLCCHFSSDGKFLASAGQEKKVFLWNMETYHMGSTPEEHSQMITDIRFRPDSTQLATSSFDGTVRLWDAAEPHFSLHTFTGHSSCVTSLDFHPKKTDLLCSCDDIGEIRLWNLSQHSGSLFCKEGSRHVRFQPKTGQFLAEATENIISIFDFETKRKTHALEGHSEAVQSFCWDQKGDYLASVSRDAVKVWSLTSGKPIYELNSSGNSFHSCVFHPTHCGILILGGYQTLQLWNVMEERITTQTVHRGLISSLAHSAAAGTIASASHDGIIKLWNVNGVMQRVNT